MRKILDDPNLRVNAIGFHTHDLDRRADAKQVLRLTHAPLQDIQTAAEYLQGF